MLDSHRFQAARSLGARGLDARGLGDRGLAVLCKARARGLGVRRVHGQRMAVRRWHTRPVAVVQRRYSRALAVRKGYALRLAALRLSDPPLACAQESAVRKRHARALRSSARPLARAKMLAEARASATFPQAPNASSLVAQASLATVLIARFRCAMPRASRKTLLASATAMESSAPDPPPTLGLRRLRVTGLGTPRSPESSSPRAAT
jgi:hypothetical protein